MTVLAKIIGLDVTGGGHRSQQPLLDALAPGIGDLVALALRPGAGLGLDLRDEPVAHQSGERGVDLTIGQRLGGGEPVVPGALEVVAVTRPGAEQSKKSESGFHVHDYTLSVYIDDILREEGVLDLAHAVGWSRRDD